MARKSIAFYDRGSWHHRVKILQGDGTTKYARKGGFATEEDAERSYYECDQVYRKACRAHNASRSADFSLGEFLVFWLDEIYSVRAENTSKALAAYVIYDLLLPNMTQRIRLRYVNAQYLDELIAAAAKASESAGNKSRELLNIALKDAVAQGYIQRNPVPDTRPYRRKKPKIIVLDKQKISSYEVIEKEPKTVNSRRVLKVPQVILDELEKRKIVIEMQKELMGDAYIDRGYVSCAKNGLPHAPSSFNTALTKLCSRNGLPHLTVHSLRHMYATILTEQGVPLVKVSALLGHSSIHTTFEYYCDVMDEQEHILNFMNDSFIPGVGENV